MAKRFKKILVLAVIFTMTLVNYGLPLHAIAAEGQSFFSFAFFKKNEIALDAYFGNDMEDFEEIADVNETAKITLEISPLIEGYLKSGSLKFNLKNGNENNFRIQSVAVDEKEDLVLDNAQSDKLDGVEKLGITEKTDDVFKEDGKNDSENVIADNKIENVVEESVKHKEEPADTIEKNPFSGLFQTSTAEKLAEDLKNDSEDVAEANKTENVDEQNLVVDENNKEIENSEENQTVEKVESDESEKEKIEESSKEEDKIASEDEEKESEEKDISEIIEDVKGTYEVSLVGDNEIALKNIIDPTKVFIEVAYKQAEKINLEDIYGEIEIVLEGNYINKKIETLEVTRKQELFLGWEYSKDVKVASDYVKVSPFTVGQNYGTIIENVITIARENEESNFLPIKETNIKIEIPKINDKLPIAVNVAANKLMATLGKELTGKEFTKNNWLYDEETGILEIKVKNNEMLAGNGEDKFDIICRYEDYLDEEKITLDKKLLVKVEEFSSNKNNLQEIEIEEAQEKEVIAGELMSYTAIESEEKIGKGKINANYHVKTGDTRFSSTVNVTVLTSDILNEVVIEPVRESYKDGVNTEFDATQDVMYAGVRFNIAEIKEMLEQGSTIDLLDAEGNVFHSITKDVDATKIEFAHKIDTLKVRINNVKVNGNLSVEFVKAIDKSQYSQAEFVGFEKIENTYKANVKYVGFEEVFQLPEIKDEIKFSNTVTQVNLLMNKTQLSTIYENDNVEFKIDLLNNLETSDLYKNPSFELVFPTFVKDVRINNVYTLYQNGLSIRDYNVVDVNGLKRIVVNLDGIQNGFNFSNITNGTNVIVNANISVDEITPQKEDQIELYYCNEATTNYQTQANWNMTRNIPEGVLSDKCGYDAARFIYKTPSGMITINSITNYDGTGKTITSFNQGEVIRTIPIKGENSIATMELSVLNNTGNDCTDMVLLGRIPFEGNKDVETGKDLGTNVDTIMSSIIIPSEVNSNNTTIYYSSNPNADKNLENDANGWITGLSAPAGSKSFMIVVDGVFKPGGILKFKYDFEIPANLGYEIKMLGSFGAFYNTLDSYKATIADRVGLITEAGAKYEANMSVNIGENATVGEARYLKYTVEVKNTGSIDLENIKIVNEKPIFGTIVSDELIEGALILNIDKLKVGEKAEKIITVKTDNLPKNLENYALAFKDTKIELDENKNFKFYKLSENNEKIYITEIPEEIFVENFATVYVGDSAKGVTTNTVKNKLINSKFDINAEVFTTVGTLNPGEQFKYSIDVQNISNEKITNIVIEDILPKELKYLSIEQAETEYKEEFDEERNAVKVSVGDLNAGETAKFYIHCEVIIKNKGRVDTLNYVNIEADGDIKESCIPIETTLLGPELSVIQETNAIDNTVLETEKFDVILNINNKGEASSQAIDIKIKIPEALKIVDIVNEGSRMINYSIEGDELVGTLYSLDGNDVSRLILKLKTVALEEGENNRIAKIESTVNEAYIGNIEVNPLTITILDNPDRDLTEEEKENIDKENTIEDPTIGEDYKEDIKQDKENQANNNSNNVANNNNDNNNNNNANPPRVEETKEPVKEIKKYKISGQIFKDANRNNAKDNNESGISKVEVSLYNNSEKLKTVVTDSLGKYRFTEIASGDYTVVFNYDGDEFVASKYKADNIVESMNSDAIESEQGIAVTEVIKINDSDMEVDLGLQERNNFDIKVQKYISKAIVNTKGKEKVEEYNDESLAKLEIRSKELSNTTIQLEYKIVVTNIGDVNGTVGYVYDYLPKELEFDEKQNKDWKLDSDGILKNQSLNEEIIKPGESRELKLVLSKVMTNDNTGTISNKVQIDMLSTDKSLEDDIENNIATQEIIITVSTGRTISLVVMIVLIIMATIIIYGIKTGKIKKAYK